MTKDEPTRRLAGINFAIPVEEAIARVEAPLQEMGETLETPYDSAYISRKDAALREAGFDVLRIRIVPEDGVA